MANEQNVTLSRLLQIVVPVASVAIALTSLFLGLSARRKELSCIYLGSERLVSVSYSMAPDLSVRYHGEPVTSLTKMSYVIRNAGAVAIKGTDIVEPLELDYPDGTKILNAGVDSTIPPEFSFSAMPKDNSVSLGFALLNPGDEAYVAVYVYNSDPRYPKLRGRIVDVHLSQASDVRDSQGRALPFISNSSTRKITFWTLLGVNGVIGMGLFGLWLYAAWETAAASRWRRRWKAAYAMAIEELKEADKPAHERLTKSMDKAGFNSQYLGKGAQNLLRQKGIPEPPTSGFDTATEALGITILLVGLSASFLFTCLYIYTGPR
jgi:hypothetical protein